MVRIASLAFLALVVGWSCHGVDVYPPFQRLELRPDDITRLVLLLRAPPGERVLSAATDCACLRAELALPAAVPPSGALEIPLRVTGVRPGVEEATIHTTAGSVTARIQIVGPGTGQGLPLLTTALKEAAANRWTPWGIVHRLAGAVRACGCSQGSLGGAGHLAALPAQAAALAPSAACRWVLTGDADGKTPGLGAALAERGWSLGDPAIVLADDPVPHLQAPGVVAVIPTSPVSMEHRRILRPVLDGGLVVELLLVDAQGIIQKRRILPVDATLADDPAFVARFPDPLTKVVTTVMPSESCRDCHARIVDHWAGTRHALAYARLPVADRTDTCITCHTLPLAGKAVAPGVHCQSCHSGTAEHVASRGGTRTTGTVDCRSCHDARHHPGFDRAKLWEVIRHGR